MLGYIIKKEYDTFFLETLSALMHSNNHSFTRGNNN